MSMSANLHGVIRAEALELPNASSLRLINGDNCSFTIFMPYATAVAMADAFNNPGRVKDLTVAASHVLHDIDDLVANSEGVTGLHQNGDVAEWPDILEGGSFGEWLMSVEVLRNVLTPKPATDEATA